MWKWGLRIDEICSSIVQGSVDFFVVVSHLVGWSGWSLSCLFLFLLSHYFLFAVKVNLVLRHKSGNRKEVKKLLISKLFLISYYFNNHNTYTMYRRSLILRHSNLPSRCINIIRNYSNSQPSDNKYKDYDFIIEENRSPQDIVKNYLSPEQIEGHIESEGVYYHHRKCLLLEILMELLSRKNSAEARLDDRTLEGKIDHSITRITPSYSQNYTK